MASVFTKPPHTILRKAGIGISLLALTACASTPSPVQQPQSQASTRTQPVVPSPDNNQDTGANQGRDTDAENAAAADAQRAMTRDGITPPHMAGRDIKRLALLLPFSAKSERLRAEANSMLKAAELAIFNRSDADIVLITLDTKGTASGASTAAQAASKAGVDVILGPILASSVKAASSHARRKNIPLVAFSTDQNVAQRGTYLLSFPPEAEVRRVVEFAATTGVTRFAYLGPESRYGQRVNQAYQQAVSHVGGEITASDSYRGNDISVMQGPAQQLAKFLEEKDKQNNGMGQMAFEAIILPEGGNALRSLAPLLPYAYDGMADVQFLGTSKWQNVDTAREPALNGGIFAGPDEEARKTFLNDYDRSYGNDPSKLASLAYDAVNVGAVIADGDPRKRIARAEDPAGFYGVDGLVRFNPDGTPERGLAVFQIRNGRFLIIDPAPRKADGPS
ncbi:MAG: penicillin-binding protein activator [Maricaulaceae bacterium]